MTIKFKLTSETETWFGRALFRTETVTDFENVRKGNKGGFVEKESNLSQLGNAWIYGDARVSGTPIPRDLLLPAR